MKFKLWHSYLIGLVLISIIGSLVLGPSIGGELMGTFVIWGSIGFGIYSLTKNKVGKKIAVIIGSSSGLILFSIFSYVRHM